MPRTLPILPFLLVAAVGAAGCAADDGAQLVFELDHALTTPAQFFDAPWPSDLRVDGAGHPIVDGWPTRDSSLFGGLRDIAKERRGFPVLPVAYFRFTSPSARAASTRSCRRRRRREILLVDVDPASPERGRLFPTVARTMVADDYLPDNVLAVAPRPGFVLAPARSYAFVVMRTAGDAAGKPLGVAPAMRALADGHAPSGSQGAAAQAAYAPLLATLATLGVDAREVAAATAFTTGDVVQETVRHLDRHASATYPAVDPRPRRRSRRRRARTIASASSSARSRCRSSRRARRRSTPTAASSSAPTGCPRSSATEDVPITITLPKLADAGRRLSARRLLPRLGRPRRRRSSIAATTLIGRRTCRPRARARRTCSRRSASPLAASALPVNPERLPGASETAVPQPQQPRRVPRHLPPGHHRAAALPRGAAHARRSIRRRWSTACNVPALPAGATAYHFDPGHARGAGAVDGRHVHQPRSAPSSRASRPWCRRAPAASGACSSCHDHAHPEQRRSCSAAGSSARRDQLTFMHPGCSLLETAWEPVEPMVYMPRLARRPLAGHPVRPVYEPVGKDDSLLPDDALRRDRARLRSPAGRRRGLADDAGRARARRARRHRCPIPSSTIARRWRAAAYTGDGRAVPRATACSDPHAIYRAARRGEVPVRLLPRDLPADGQGRRARAGAARHALSAALSRRRRWWVATGIRIVSGCRTRKSRETA